MAVVRLEIRLGGGGGVGRQAVSQLVGIAEFVDGENEYFVLVLMLRGRREVPGSASIVLEGNVVSLQLLDVLSGESIVAQQLVVAPAGGLHRTVLYVSDLVKVRSFARPIGSCLLGDVLGLPPCSGLYCPARLSSSSDPSGFALRVDLHSHPA